jgi:hypothetical protein
VSANAFTDSAWIAELDVHFARFYLGAVESSLSGKPTPGCWQALFDQRGNEQIARIQFAIAGINAHINHDLPQAVVATCQATGIAPAHGTTQYNDYTQVNSTLDSLMTEAKQTLHVRLPGNALPPVAALDDRLEAWSVEAAREAAWNNAELLWHLSGEPAISATLMDTLDGFTALASKTLLVPVP